MFYHIKIACYQAIKKLNLSLEATGKHRILQLHELQELRNEAYENFKLYTERMKTFHDKHLRRRSFFEGQKVWLYNSRRKLFPRKLKSRWEGPFTISKISNNGAFTITNHTSGKSLNVNGQRLKPYLESTPNPLHELPITLQIHHILKIRGSNSLLSSIYFFYPILLIVFLDFLLLFLPYFRKPCNFTTKENVWKSFKKF